MIKAQVVERTVEALHGAAAEVAVVAKDGIAVGGHDGVACSDGLAGAQRQLQCSTGAGGLDEAADIAFGSACVGVRQQDGAAADVAAVVRHADGGIAARAGGRCGSHHGGAHAAALQVGAVDAEVAPQLVLVDIGRIGEGAGKVGHARRVAAELEHGARGVALHDHLDGLGRSLQGIGARLTQQVGAGNDMGRVVTGLVGGHEVDGPLDGVQVVGHPVARVIKVGRVHDRPGNGTFKAGAGHAHHDRAAVIRPGGIGRVVVPDAGTIVGDEVRNVGVRVGDGAQSGQRGHYGAVISR